MPAYWLARGKVNDPAEYKKYADQVPAILAKYGGRALARGGRFQIMEGPDTFQRFVVIEFPTFEQGVACFTSAEYEKAAAFRRNGAGEVMPVIPGRGESRGGLNPQPRKLGLSFGAAPKPCHLGPWIFGLAPLAWRPPE